MSRFFNSKESQAKQLVKNRLRSRLKRRVERNKVLKSLESKIQEASDSSALAELLATQVTQSKKEIEDKFEISLEDVDKKLFASE